MIRKLAFLLVFLCLIQGTIQADDREIYFARVTDTTGDQNVVYELAFAPSKVYVEAKKGNSNVNIPFSKIQYLEITDHEQVSIRTGIYTHTYYPGYLVLLSGDEFEIFVKAQYFMGKTEFSDRYRIDVESLKSIEFLHDGRYKQCPLCNTKYYNTEIEYCRFDREKLIQK